ncbi:hypothetical protein [Tenacibaculum caenipelagi]|uniref:Uncharacterized protein n=1 Tax=Tenacibaculum caenipelagi TaxID=1325435 RepID=A0A4R6TEY0_9FLAO|nr:hypothetical protein [Tenacibaculum caenipelagi]TDQ25686.1 hypothetical protein DFQ07_2112 [Tenacibaculum caenipelagi]
MATNIAKPSNGRLTKKAGEANMVSPTNGMYNTLCQSLNLSNKSFQMIQGVLPVQSSAPELYNYFDGVPPKSVGVLYEGNPLNTLSGNYATMLSKTEDTNTFLYKIAMSNYTNSNNWIGGNMGTNPVYTPSFKELEQLVEKGSTATISFDSATSNDNIENSWAQSNGSSGVGFWGKKENSVSKSLNEIASASRITVDMHFNKYAFIPVRAGGWFFSGYFTDMYQNPDQFQSDEDWDKLFGPSGSLQRVANQVLLVSGYTITVRSWATYSQSDFEEIQKSTETNVWPFYTSGSSSKATSSYRFNDDKSISVIITSAPGNLQIFGMGVIPTDRAVTGGSDNHVLKAPSRLI